MGAVVAPLSEVPQEGSSVLSLFSLIKLHLASQPLPSSYRCVTRFHQCFVPKIYIFSDQVLCGAPLIVG